MPEALQPVDLDRLYICYEGRANAGVPVYMYKDDPGVFMRRNGFPVSEQEARTAGFDIEHWKLEGRMQGKLAEKTAEVEAQRDQMMADIEAESKREIAAEDAAANPVSPAVSAPGAAAGTINRPQLSFDANGIGTNAAGEIRETPKYRMDHMGRGMWTIISKETNTAIKDNQTKDAATNFLLEDA